MKPSGGFVAVLMLASSLVSVSAEEQFHPHDHLLFLTTFDDTTDVNLFGPDNDAGWIYTADSTRRATTLMQNRCASVGIAEGQGKLRDCLRFGEQTRRVLFYQASPNLPLPRNNWSGSVAFWLKPKLSRLGPKASYPLQMFDGDWSRGGFFLRFPNVSRGTFEFGAVSATLDSPVALGLEEIERRRKHIVSIQNAPFDGEQWTAVAFTFEGVNVNRPGVATLRLYLDGGLTGQITAPLRVQWMHPTERRIKQDAVWFLGINYVGDVDDLRIYNKALSRRGMSILHSE